MFSALGFKHLVASPVFLMFVPILLNCFTILKTMKITKKCELRCHHVLIHWIGLTFVSISSEMWLFVGWLTRVPYWSILCCFSFRKHLKALDDLLGLIQGCRHEEQNEALTEDIKKLRAKFRQVMFVPSDDLDQPQQIYCPHAEVPATAAWRTSTCTKNKLSEYSRQLTVQLHYL